ncbi:MBL fold metallo-hydrolase [Dictyobacter kobayashii]|uniref:Metallo-beta-lactamase domain-containing protein n=1 Tax=Dictyobacter kobayashii TaxID=2014872 RepID=A0A402ARE3_9CHLR|nr:MBL fold metallo-hydrolase [Dictyobacter kobayashii]GCE21676.1 hypothetical protein KDK_54760 [Dictyobacter kobayashii]
MRIHFLRHATLLLTLNGKHILVDPMLSKAGAMDPVPNAASQQRIPMVELPLSESELHELIGQVDGVLVTHTHRDHWDARAIELLPKTLPILCQPEDEAVMKQAGFTEVLPIVQRREWNGLHIARTAGQHGTGELGKKMGPVSGFVVQAEGEPSVYIAGDTIWYDGVQQALQTFSPEVVIVNAGAATYLVGDPITMDADDVCAVARELPAAQVVAVHMEVVNHCVLTRPLLRERLESEGLLSRVLIPSDGDVLTF